MTRWRALLAPLLLAGTAGFLPAAARMGAGYPLLDTPEAGRAHVSGLVTAMARTAEGLLFVGSSRLAVFDGHHWQRIEVPGAQRITALAPDGPDRVWVGADGALGCAERDATGLWSFRSLAPELRQAEFEDDINTIFYSVFVRGPEVIFVSRTKVARWDGTRFSVFEMPSPIRLYVFSAGPDLLIYQGGAGIFRWEDGAPRLWIPQADLPTAQPLTAYVRLPDGHGIGLFYEEVYAHRAGKWRRLEPVSNELRGRRALHAVLLHDHLLAIGTAFGGVVLAGTDGQLRGLVNTRNGLPDDHIDSLAAGGDGSLWIGMVSGGLTRLTAPEAGAIFDQRSRFTAGNICRILEWEGRVRVISSRRVYAMPEVSAREPRQVGRLEQIWTRLQDATPWDDRLWLGAGDGLWSLTAAGRVDRHTRSGPVAGLVPQRDGLLYFQGSRAFRLQRAGEDFAHRDLGAVLDSPALHALQDSTGQVWVVTQAGRVHRFAPPADPAVLTALPGPAAAPGASALTTVGDLLCTVGGGRVQGWDGTAGRFVPLAAARNWRVLAATPQGDGAIWCVQDTSTPDSPMALVRVARDRSSATAVQCIPLQAPGLDQAGDVNHLAVTATPEATWLWVGGDNALLRLDVTALRDAPPAPALRLTQFSVDGARHPLPGPAAPLLPAGSSRIRFGFAAPDVTLNGDRLRFQTRLVGIDHDWSAAQPQPEWEFSALPSGQYILLARAVDRFGDGGPELRIGFHIAAPWYRTPAALVLWSGLALALAWSGYRWRTGSLRRQSARLEQLVQERTRELSLSNTAKSEFLDNLAHEIRRPANGLAAVVRELEASGLSPAQREQARLLRHATGSLARLCDEVLAFSRVDAGVEPVQHRRFLVRELLARVLAGGEAPADVTVDLPPGFADGFVGDDAKLGIIVSNFIANALRHAPGAPVVVHVGATDEGPERVQLLIEVADGGPGVPADEQEMIFRRFARGSRATRGGVPGTGIGLAMCRALARLLGGSVGVESPAEIAKARGWPGPGATFFVRVPLARPAPDVTPATA